LNRAEFCGGSNSLENGAMKKSTHFFPEVRERAARMVNALAASRNGFVNGMGAPF
jgi:hypothetical protein